MPSYATQWMRDLLADTTLTPGAKAVGCAVFYRYANERNGRTVYASHRKIEELAGTTRNAVRRALTGLTKGGWVVVVAEHGYRTASEFRIVNPTDERVRNDPSPEGAERTPYRVRNDPSEGAERTPSTDGLPIKRLTPTRPTAVPAAASSTDPDTEALRLARPGETGPELARRLIAEARQRTNDAAARPTPGVSNTEAAPSAAPEPDDLVADPRAAASPPRRERIGPTPPGMTRLEYRRQVEAQRRAAS